ncbi:DNA primase [Striga asiatica]|uniref:DNA primase n=1 Tax=Striga asiatica TaxID=4170 RepID=A0A5A7P2U3_STRAF|nr:DNA primase [Striga asiatica]
MEVVGSRRKPSLSSDGNTVSTFPIYRSAPELEVRLEDFELYAVQRLREQAMIKQIAQALLVLKGISDALSRGKKPNEMEQIVRGLLLKANMLHSEVPDVNNKDIISHFVLRLVYCRQEELRKWFLSMETTLFRYRFQFQAPDVQREIMAEFDLPYKAVNSAEYEIPGETDSSILLIKVPFEQVPDLVASRRVFILKGYAYVAMSQVVSLLVTQYRSYLSKALVLTNRKWTSMIREQEKDRLTPIVEGLATSYLGPDYSQPSDSAEISLKDIDQVAKSSFPLCMRHLFEKLREDHHLKHGGRMQLGLFLKGVGLNLDDALAFWKAEFSRKVGPERFDKEYAYSIRHNYGKEGKRTDYTPYSCQKIISSTPGVGDHHGCPYRHFSEENLRAALNKMGVGHRAVENVMDKVRNRHYQLACTLTFEAIHGTSCDEGINHPNQYYSDSKKVLESKVILCLGFLHMRRRKLPAFDDRRTFPDQIPISFPTLSDQLEALIVRFLAGQKMSQVFEGYERQYCEVSANLSKKITSAGLLDGEQKKQKLSEINGDIDNAETLIRKMDLEARSLPPSVKATLLAKLREYKTDLNNLKTEVKRITSANANLAVRDNLLESGMADTLTASADQRGRLLMSTERLNKSGERIRESRKTMLETEDLGVSILQDLHQQRQSLLHAHNALHGVDDNISRSKKILTNMSRRMNRNKWIIGSIITVLVIAILLILYFKLTH